MSTTGKRGSTKKPPSEKSAANVSNHHHHHHHHDGQRSHNAAGTHTTTATMIPTVSMSPTSPTPAAAAKQHSLSAGPRLSRQFTPPNVLLGGKAGAGGDLSALLAFGRHPVSSTAGQLFLCAIGSLLSLTVCIWLMGFSTDVRWRRVVFASAAAICAGMFSLLAVATVRRNRRCRSRSRTSVEIHADSLLRAHRYSMSLAAHNSMRRHTRSGGETDINRRQSYTGGEGASADEQQAAKTHPRSLSLLHPRPHHQHHHLSAGGGGSATPKALLHHDNNTPVVVNVDDADLADITVTIPLLNPNATATSSSGGSRLLNVVDEEAGGGGGGFVTRGMSA